MTQSFTRHTFTLSAGVFFFVLLLLLLIGRLAPFPSDALLALPAGASCLFGILFFLQVQRSHPADLHPATERTERDKLSPYSDRTDERTSLCQSTHLSPQGERESFASVSSHILLSSYTTLPFLAFLSGMCFALLSLLIASTYPNMFSALLSSTPSTLGLPIVWLFTLLYSGCASLAGYALASFLLPDRTTVISSSREDERESLPYPAAKAEMNSAPTDTDISTPPIVRSLAMLLLLCLLPTFAIALYSSLYTYVLQAFSLTQGITGPYPALRSLAVLLPWQVTAHIPVDPQNIPLSLFWYIPIESGNPWTFDAQSLIPYFLLGGILAIVRRPLSPRGERVRERGNALQASLLKGFSGVLLMLPALLWVLPGIQGILQVHGIVVTYPALILLNNWMIPLNLLTAFFTTGLVAILTRTLFSYREAVLQHM